MNDNTQLSFDEKPLSQVPFEDLTDAGLTRDPYFGGPEIPGEIDYRRLKVSVGNRPLSWRLPDLFQRGGQVIPKDLKLYQRWDVWMIAHAISVADRGEFATLLNSVVDAVGYEAEFKASQAVTVALQPEPANVRRVGGSLQVTVDVGLDGSTSGQAAATDGVTLPLMAGASLGFSAGAQAFGRLTFGVWTPTIVTTGICSGRAEWLFNREDAPLRNSQVMFQTVLVPAGTKSLKFKCRAYALIRSVGFIPIPSRFETSWVEVSTSPIAALQPAPNVAATPQAAATHSPEAAEA
jgi:hypothetical protein